MQQKSKVILGHIVNGLTIVIYFALLFVLEIHPALQVLQYVGWILFAAGIAFIILSISTLHRKHTETVISSGVFGVIRHPIYLGSIFLYLAMAFFLPHWIMAALSAFNVVYIYWFMALEEQENIKKFGVEYERYMQSVPRANLLAGFIQLLRSKNKEK